MDKQQVIALGAGVENGSRWNASPDRTRADVYRLRGSIGIEYSLARYGAARLWQLFRMTISAVLSAHGQSAIN